jgi:hypothetical protein
MTTRTKIHTRITLHLIVLAAALALAGCKKKDDAQAGNSSSAKGADGAPAKSGIAECDEYLDAMAKFATCDKMQPAERDAYGKDVPKQRAEYASLKTDDQKQKAAATCKEAMGGLVEGAKFRNCPLK